MNLIANTNVIDVVPVSVEDVDDDDGAVGPQQLAETQKSVHPAKVVDSLESSPMLTDLYDGLVLLKRSMHLLAVLGDKDLSGTIVKRDRERMLELSNDIKPYIEETVLQWDLEQAFE